MELKRVVVTGMGALTPVGSNLQDYWAGLISGKSGAGPISRFDASKFKTQFACEIKDWDFNAHFDRKEARKLDPVSQYALVAADEAIIHSGLALEGLDLDRCGVIWGGGIGGLKTFQDEVGEFAKSETGIPRFNPFFIPKMIVDITPGHISIKYGFRGPNYSTVSACASGTHAIIDAFNVIRLGKADVMLTGGSEAAVTEAGVGGFNAMKALSERNDSAETASRPFDLNRDGFVLGEGAGAIVLEEYAFAKARGATIYAELVGGGMNADAHHITAPHPEGLGARNVMKLAIEDAGFDPGQVDYVNVHGTSTPLGDIAEAQAIMGVFGEHAYQLNISSTKSMTGHLLGAAGAIEAIASIQSIVHGQVPPTINHSEVDPAIDGKLNFTFNTAQKREVRAALSNTFGFGGHNASLLFKKFES